MIIYITRNDNNCFINSAKELYNRYFFAQYFTAAASSKKLATNMTLYTSG